jgi:hypothetical protein
VTASDVVEDAVEEEVTVRADTVVVMLARARKVVLLVNLLLLSVGALAVDVERLQLRLRRWMDYQVTEAVLAIYLWYE